MRREGEDDRDGRPRLRRRRPARKGVADSSVVPDALRAGGCLGGVGAAKGHIKSRRRLAPAKRKAVAPRGSRGRRFGAAPGEACQKDRGFVKVADSLGRECRVARLAMACRHRGTCCVEFFPNAGRENPFMGVAHASMVMGVPERVPTDSTKGVVTRGDIGGRPAWRTDRAALMGCVGFKTRPRKPRHPFRKRQGRAAGEAREGGLPGRQGVRQHHRAQRRGAGVARRAGRPLPPRARPGARRRAPRQMPAALERSGRGRRGGPLPVPQAQGELRRLRHLRGRAVRRAPLASRQGVPRRPRGRAPAHLQRGPLPRAPRAPRHMGAQGRPLRGPVRRRAAARAADGAGQGDGRAAGGAVGQPRLLEARFRGGP